MLEIERDDSERDRKTGRARFDRSDPQSARKVIETLIPKEEARLVGLELLAESIMTAHETAPASWSVTLFPDGLRLNVGSVEVFVVGRGWRGGIYILVDPKAIDKADWRQAYSLVEWTSASYASLPEAKGVIVPFYRMPSAIPAWKNAHLALVRLAATSRRNGVWKRSHSHGVIEYLEQELGVEMPEPVGAGEAEITQSASSLQKPISIQQFSRTEKPSGITNQKGPETADANNTNEDASHPSSSGSRMLNPDYPFSRLVEETGFSPERLRLWLRALERKKQVVLYGPPGTGKTYVAERLALHLAGGTDGLVEFLQFHPSYSYEDFIQGLRPRTVGPGTLTYEWQDGRFLDFCNRARTRLGRSVLIIDEINRANLASVFGELMYLLEYREREVVLPGGAGFSIPDNVRVIGTMNTADRSIALVDHALRRRFAFLPLYPDYDLIRRRAADLRYPVENLIRVLQRINQTISDPNYALGVSFFFNGNTIEDLEEIWRLEIEPYLEELFFDQPARMNDFRWEKIREAVLSDDGKAAHGDGTGSPDN